MVPDHERCAIAKIRAIEITINERALENHIRLVACQFAAAQLRMIIRLREVISGDTDDALIVLSIIVIFYSQVINKRGAVGGLDWCHLRENSTLPTCNISSIAAAADLPRETTRRKLVELETRGVVERPNRNSVVLSVDTVTGKQIDTLMARSARDLLKIVELFISNGLVSAQRAV